MYSKNQIASALARYPRREIIQSEYPTFSRAAVLVPLFPKNDNLSVILTVRTNEVDTHKGQISFPGGMQDSSDADAIHAALREAHEEVGIKQASVEILGLLDDVATPSQYLITPVVGYLQRQPVYSPNRGEVAEVIDLPVAFFSDDKNGRWEMRERNGVRVKVWFFQYGKYLIWGATAMMMRNLTELLQGKP